MAIESAVDSAVMKEYHGYITEGSQYLAIPD